jgi:hypothetical protein
MHLMHARKMRCLNAHRARDAPSIFRNRSRIVV